VHFLLLFISAVLGIQYFPKFSKKFKIPLFSIALGIIPYYIAGELFPQNFRSTGQAIVFFTFFLLAFVFNSLTLPLYASIGVWCFLPLFIIPQIFCLTILWKFLPETR